MRLPDAKAIFCHVLKSGHDAEKVLEGCSMFDPIADLYQRVAELERRIANMVQIGTVQQTRADTGQMSVRVAVGDRVSDWLPMNTLNNRFVRAYVPPTNGQQVLILNPFGDADGGLVVGTYGHEDSPEPDGGDGGTAVVDFGGVRFSVTGEGVTISAAEFITLDTPVVRCTKNVDVGEQLHAGAGLSTDGDVTDGCGDLSNFATTDGAERAC